MGTPSDGKKMEKDQKCKGCGDILLEQEKAEGVCSDCVVCPACEGKGTYDVSINNVNDGTTDSMNMTCFTCKGSGGVTKEKMAQLQAEQELWCDCGNPSGDVDFWNDGEHPNCSKHCYTCKDCDKIVQVG